MIIGEKLMYHINWSLAKSRNRNDERPHHILELSKLMRSEGCEGKICGGKSFSILFYEAQNFKSSCIAQKLFHKSLKLSF